MFGWEGEEQEKAHHGNGPTTDHGTIGTGRAESQAIGQVMIV